tara:strand:- start:4039 stop:4620 length:582 start_codon:yes stop_codon:yes gene_type:complete
MYCDMANVLPKEQRKILSQHYWLRLVSVASFMFSGAMIIGGVALLPSYLSAKADLESAVIEQELQRNTREATKEDGAIQEARLVNLQIDEVLKIDNTNPSGAIDSIVRDWEPHSGEVVLSNITYQLEERVDKKDKKVITTVTMRLSGTAANREALNEFVKTLRKDPMFSEVSFPVSDLIGVEAIDFSLVMNVL